MVYSRVQIVHFAYKNWRGECGIRKVVPIRIFFGKNEFHNGKEQWFMEGWDVDKQAKRSFALNDTNFRMGMELDTTWEERADNKYLEESPAITIPAYLEGVAEFRKAAIDALFAEYQKTAKEGILESIQIIAKLGTVTN